MRYGRFWGVDPYGRSWVSTEGGPDVLSLGDLALLLAGLILLVWRQGRHLRSVITRARADIVRTIQTQHAAQQDIVMSLKAIAEALAGFRSDIRRLGTRIGAARHGSPTADTCPGRSDPLPLVVVRRDEIAIFRVMQARLDKPDLARVIWDRRVAERRQRNERASERRQGERRGREPVTWTGLGYLVIEPHAVDT